MQRIKFMYRVFMKEPLWFKILIFSTFVISIVFSSSNFSHHTNYESLSKLAAAIFFCAFGFKLRRNPKIAIIFYAFAAICFYLAWSNFDYSN